MKAQAGYSSRGWKDCICREEKRKAAWGMQRDLETGNRKLVVLWVRLEIGFYSLFCVLPEGGDISQVWTDISWEGEVSPWPIITFWDLLQSVLQVPPLSGCPNCC
jgi:hypothetical protein